MWQFLNFKLIIFLSILFSFPAFGEDQSIRIGWIGPMSGPQAKWGSYQAVQLALEEINFNGGINKHPVKLIFEDGKGLGKDATSAAQKLINVDKVNYILGGHCSPESLAIAPIAEKANVLMLAAVSGSPLFNNAGDNIFRVTAVNIQSVDKVFDYATKVRGINAFSILFEESDYPRPQAERFKKRAEESGVLIDGYEGVLPNEIDFRSILLRMKKKKTKGLYLATLSPDTAAILLRQIRDLKFDVEIFGNENTGNSVNSSGQDKTVFEDVVFSVSEDDVNNEIAEAFKKKYFAKYKTTALPYGAYTAESYDSLNLLSSLIKKCGDSVEKVKKCLYQVKDYKGASGIFSIDMNGDGVRNFKMKTVKDGKIVNIVLNSDQ
jgi:branched-chain amino acid transport system substrate-binding protein